MQLLALLRRAAGLELLQQQHQRDVLCSPPLLLLLLLIMLCGGQCGLLLLLLLRCRRRGRPGCGRLLRTPSSSVFHASQSLVKWGQMGSLLWTCIERVVDGRPLACCTRCA